MGNFNPDGHISSEGFQKLIFEETTELERLEFSEHLSFCPRCMDEYMISADSILNSEPAPFDGEILAGRIIRRNAISRLRVYFSTGIAAAAAIVFINMCLFSPGFAQNLSEKAAVLRTSVSTLDVSEKLTHSFNRISDNLDFKFFEEDFINGSQKK